VEKIDFTTPQRRSAPAPAADPSVCPRCRGRGWRVDADGGAGRAVACECRQAKRWSQLLDAANIPEHYRGKKLAAFQTTGPDEFTRASLRDAVRVCKDYVETFLDSTEGAIRNTGLLLVGPPGVGKTHLAVSVLTEVIERYAVRGRFVDFTALLFAIQSTFDDDSTETRSGILRPILEADFLVLDELGIQRPTEWMMQHLYWIVNTRYLERRPTIFTTNYRLDRTSRKAPDPKLDRMPGPDDLPQVKERFELLSHRISPPLVSRLYEMAQIVELGGQDYRREVKAHQHRRSGV
jgi:DNA replication protein DnaC